MWQVCLRGDCFSLSVVSIILLRLASYSGHLPSCQILLGSQQLLVSQYSAAVTDYSSADSTALTNRVRLATWSTIRDKSREKEWYEKDYATTTASSTVTMIVVENKRQSLEADRLPKIIPCMVATGIFYHRDTFDHIQLLCFQREISFPNATKSEFEHFMKVLTVTCQFRGISSRRPCFGAVR